jgi:hypothetical protein
MPSCGCFRRKSCRRFERGSIVCPWRLKAQTGQRSRPSSFDEERIMRHPFLLPVFLVGWVALPATADERSLDRENRRVRGHAEIVFGGSSDYPYYPRSDPRLLGLRLLAGLPEWEKARREARRKRQKDRREAWREAEKDRREAASDGRTASSLKSNCSN